MKLTYQYQDNLLLNDILIRNYFNMFNSNKNINLTFFYNDNYSNKKYIPDYEPLENHNNDLQNILNNWELFLNWYKYNNFNTKILIHDDILFNNISFFQTVLLKLFEKNIEYKELTLVINYNTQVSFKDFIELIKKYVNKNINCIFNININDITEENLQLLNTYGLINIIIPPGLTGKELIQYQNIINNKNCNINNYIEQDSTLWDEKNIQEYLIYIQYLLDMFLEKPRFLFSSKLPVGIVNQHTIDNTQCKKNCCFQNSFNVLLSNLSINLCHKFQYDDQIIGYLRPNNNETIFSIEANIIPLIMLNTHLKRTSTPHCETCSFIGICKGFCFAESYNVCFNPAIPIRESCMLKKAKFSFIFKYLQNKIDFEYYINQSLCINDSYKNYLLSIVNQTK